VGSILDAALGAGLDDDGGEADYDGVDGFYPLVNMSPIEADDVVIERDGADGERAVVVVSGPLRAVHGALSVQGAQPRPFDADVRIEYSLGPSDRALAIQLSLGPPARVRLDLRDTAGTLAPGKITFLAEDTRTELCVACGERALHEWLGARQVAWTANGTAELALEAGVYTITASHGPMRSSTCARA